MILPAVKLGTLALKTICKPIANRLKKEAGLHPRFRQFIVNIAQVHSCALCLLLYFSFKFFQILLHGFALKLAFLAWVSVFSLCLRLGSFFCPHFCAELGVELVIIKSMSGMNMMPVKVDVKY